ncbi:MAG: hypothetical protein ABEJ75_01790 [Candidatus Nanohaloarchaea archaeon]
MRKGQVAIEFMTLVGFSMLLLAIMMGFVAKKQSRAVQYHNYQTARDIAENVAFQAEMALVQGDGYSRRFFLPTAIGGRNYNVTVRNNTVYLAWGEGFVTEPTLYRGRTLRLKSRGTTSYKVLNNGSVYIIR